MRKFINSEANLAGDSAQRIEHGWLEQIASQLRAIWPTIFLVLITAVVLLGIMTVLHEWRGVPYSNMTRDPLSIMELPMYIGLLSQLGFYFWAAATAVPLFAALLLWQQPNRTLWFWFMGASGILGLILGFDDGFMLHENVFPVIGISERLLFGLYGIMMLGWLVTFRTLIISTDFLLPAASFLFFALSIGIDALDDFGLVGQGNLLLEDGFKMVGILFWTAYIFRVAKTAVYTQFDPSPG